GHALKESGELRDHEKLSQAESAYRQALSLDPHVADTYIQLGHILKLQGETDGAAACYLRAFALDPSTPYPAVELSGLGWSEAQIAELTAPPQTQRREAAPGPIVGDISEGRLLPAARRSVDVPDLFAL